jgi:multicomponent Na+:H+ antiporter subunit F
VKVAWLITAGLLAAALITCAAVTLRGDLARRLVGLEMTGVIESLLLLTLAAASGRPSFADAGLTLALLAFGGGLVFARFLERS